MLSIYILRLLGHGVCNRGLREIVKAQMASLLEISRFYDMMRVLIFDEGMKSCKL